MATLTPQQIWFLQRECGIADPVGLMRENRQKAEKAAREQGAIDTIREARPDVATLLEDAGLGTSRPVSEMTDLELATGLDTIASGQRRPPPGTYRPTRAGAAEAMASGPSERQLSEMSDEALWSDYSAHAVRR